MHKGFAAIQVQLQRGDRLSQEDVRWLVQLAQIQHATLVAADQSLRHVGPTRDVCQTRDTIAIVQRMFDGETQEEARPETPRPATPKHQPLTGVARTQAGPQGSNPARPCG